MSEESSKLGVSEASDRAADALDVILRGEEKNRVAEAEGPVELEEVEAAKTGKQVLSSDTGRDMLRVLFITKETDILNTDSLALQRLSDLNTKFDEIHIIVLSRNSDERDDILRIGNRMWVYPTCSRYWWQTIYDAYKLAIQQLEFANSFRPDVVVSFDPFESGVVGLMLARKYKRSFQVHILDDFNDPTFIERDKNNDWRVFMAKLVLMFSKSVRVGSDDLLNQIEKKYRRLAGKVKLLPFYFDLDQIRDMEPRFNLKERYPQFSFLILTASPLTESAHVDLVLNSSFKTLQRAPVIGLIIVGNGPRRAYLEERALALNIADSVIFEPWTSDLISHLKTADVYLNFGTDRNSEKRILEVAAAGLPFISVATETLTTLFEGEEAGFLCPDGDFNTFSKNLDQILSNNSLRRNFSKNARSIVFQRLENNTNSYRLSYRNQIEEALQEDPKE